MDRQSGRPVFVQIVLELLLALWLGVTGCAACHVIRALDRPPASGSNPWR